MFSDDFKTTPYWWDATPRPQLPLVEMPASTDVVIVGAGYSGLSAALQIARAGREVLVLDAEDAGWGCSTRNGGQISTSLKPDLAGLSKRYGAEQALKVLQEGHRSLQWVQDFIQQEQIECSLKVSGKFLGAHNPKQYEQLARIIENPVAGLETDAYMLGRDEQSAEIESPFYYGGAVYPRIASVDPGKFHQGILERVMTAGASVKTHCPVISITAQGSGFRVDTASASVLARDVIVATNGYTGQTTPWQRRRVIPIGSYIIATEELEPGLMDRLIPKDRMLGDTRKLVFYYRASPDRKRIVFGGRVSIFETDSEVTGPRLFKHLVEIFPQLSETRISHSWGGFVGYTFDTLPHLGRKDGLYYSMGYCGSGVGMATYLGMRIAQQLLGKEEGRTAFDNLAFQTRPLYTGTPWFLAASVLYYRWLDSRQ